MLSPTQAASVFSGMVFRSSTTLVKKRNFSSYSICVGSSSKIGVRLLHAVVPEPVVLLEGGEERLGLDGGGLDGPVEEQHHAHDLEVRGHLVVEALALLLGHVVLAPVVELLEGLEHHERAVVEAPLDLLEVGRQGDLVVHELNLELEARVALGRRDAVLEQHQRSLGAVQQGLCHTR